jgi:hypothetical protein
MQMNMQIANAHTSRISVRQFSRVARDAKRSAASNTAITPAATKEADGDSWVTSEECQPDGDKRHQRQQTGD